MTVPIILNGEKSGTLEIRRDGAFTLFEGRCAGRRELLRLWVFGGEGRGYLGVMQPEGDALVLRRRLSRTAMRAFPSAIAYAGEAPLPQEKAAPPEKRERVSGGALLLREGEGRYLALPCALRRPVPGTRRRIIDGVEYLLFRC